MKHFWQRESAGDIIYLMAAIKAYGGGALSIRRTGGHGFDQFATLRRLALTQPYIYEFTESENCPADAVDMRAVIDSGSWVERPNIIRPLFQTLSLPFKTTPWLQGFGLQPAMHEPDGYSIVNVTKRYRDDQFRWGEVLPAGEMRFLGTPQEYDEFTHYLGWSGYGDAAKRLSHVNTIDFYEAAQQINGARAFFGNASACLAIAQGLGLREINVEVNLCTINTCLLGGERILNVRQSA